MTAINVNPAKKLPKAVKIFSFMGILEKTMLRRIDITKAAAKNIKPSKYLLITMSFLDTGIVRAYLSHLHLSS